MGKFIDLLGMKFGRYTVLQQHTDRQSWLCLCDCGRTQRVTSANLRSGKRLGCSKCANHGRVNIVGKVFGKLTVESYSHTRKKVAHWVCSCECGGRKTISGPQLKAGFGLSCGCVKPNTRPIKDISGMRFGRLIAQEITGQKGQGNYIWKCLCDCGKTAFLPSGRLLKGAVRSCGCYRLERVLYASVTHGEARLGKRTLRYTIWVAAKKRARDGGLAFDLDLDDIVIPEVCPLLGTPIESNKNGVVAKSNSPSLDKIIPGLGYVKGNIWVISHRANTIKNDASVQEIELIAQNLRRKVDELNGDTSEDQQSSQPLRTSFYRTEHTLPPSREDGVFLPA